MESLDEIINTIQTLYIKNINFLSSYDPSLFKKIKNFEEKNIENFSLEFIDNHFEIVDKEGNKTYNCDPFYDAQYRTKNILSNKGNLALINETKREIKNNDPYDSNLFINQFVNIIESNKTPENINYKKTIFAGTLLGIHINDLDSILQSESYLILEKDIEIFRLSLFFTDYEEISNHSKIFFAIEESADTLENIIKRFYEHNYQNNNYIKFEVASEKYIDILEAAIDHILPLNPTIYPYSEIIKSYTNGINNFLDAHNGILNLSLPIDTLNNYPSLLLAPGPSLAKEIELIKKNQDKYLIICVISALKELEANDIIPDIIISIDSNDLVLTTIEGVDEKYYKNSIILASINTAKSVFEKINHKYTYLMQNSLELFHGYGYYTGVSVGDIGVKVLLQLGVKKLFLCGLDAALDQDTGLSHVNSHISSQEQTMQEKSLIENDNFNYKDKTIKVKGNFEKEVISTLYYKTIIDSFKDIVPDNKTTIYNLSHGAYLENTKPLKKKAFLELNKKILDKKALQNNILQTLNMNIKSKLSPLDKLFFEKELESVTNYENVKNKNSFTAKIIEQFNNLILPYKEYIKSNYTELNGIETIYEKQKTCILKTQERATKKLLQEGRVDG